jgi:hypothetical protein
MERIQILLDPLERERFRRLAQARGLSLSAWLREAALKQAAMEGRQFKIRSVEALRAFFAECDALEQGVEPEWAEHLAVIEASRLQGAGEPTGALPGDATRSNATSSPASRRVTARKRR